MGWFTPRGRSVMNATAPKPDPIEDICSALANRPHEWSASAGGAIVHSSGVSLSWITVPRDLSYPTLGGNKTVAILAVDGQRIQQSDRDSDRLHHAVSQRAAALVSRPRHTFTDAAKALARSVLDGDEQAAYALADEVMEFARGARP